MTKRPISDRVTAELCRRLASIPTSGGHRADRVLLTLAAKLDQETTAKRQQGDMAYLAEAPRPDR